MVECDAVFTDRREVEISGRIRECRKRIGVVLVFYKYGALRSVLKDVMIVCLFAFMYFYKISVDTLMTQLVETIFSVAVVT